MKVFLPLVVFALSGCATVAAPRQPATDLAASAAPGTLSITGEQLKQTGRSDVSDALRMVSPIFH